ncbi:MAG: TonB-dependent receptor, partial [Bacteroidota bacterium]
FQFPFDNGEIDRWPMVPSWMGQARISFEPVKSLLIGINANFSGSWVSRGILTEDELDEFEDFVVQSGYFTLDLRARYKLNKHFQVYLKVNNALNKEYAGISATGTLYDLVYNPQLRRTLEYGLSFRFN